MCLSALGPRSNKHGVWIAGYDILVWKRLVPDYWGSSTVAGTSPFQHQQYFYDATYRAKLGIKRDSYRDYRNVRYTYYTVHKGLHAYTTRLKRTYFSNEKLFPAVIPKGARFIVGENHEVVSTQLRILRAKPKQVPRRGDWSRHTFVRKL